MGLKIPKMIITPPEVRYLNDYTAGKTWKIEKYQHILETAFRLFSERGIEGVTMPEVAKASGIGRSTLYRYFASKLDLVVAIGTWTWKEYISAHNTSVPKEELDAMSGAERFRFYMDAFLDLYRNHNDLLRFNYNFNGFLRYEAGTSRQKEPYTKVVDRLSEMFHEVYERGMKDGTLRPDISEEIMFSSSFHIMLAAATRYAVGLVYIVEGCDPEKELAMLEEALLRMYIREQ